MVNYLDHRVFNQTLNLYYQTTSKKVVVIYSIIKNYMWGLAMTLRIIIFGQDFVNFICKQTASFGLVCTSPLTIRLIFFLGTSYLYHFLCELPDHALCQYLTADEGREAV